MISNNYYYLIELIGTAGDRATVSNFILHACKYLATSGYGNDLKCIEKVRADYREWLEKRGMHIKYDGKTAANCFSMLKNSCSKGSKLSDENWTVLTRPPMSRESVQTSTKEDILIDLSNVSIGIEIAVCVTGNKSVAKFLLSKIAKYIDEDFVYVKFSENEISTYFDYIDTDSSVNKQWRLSLDRCKKP